MNRILRFIYAALIVSTAVACHTSEIDNPNKDNPDKPQITDNIQLTASIKQTRVEYSINGEELEQKWMVGDAIYGFYGEEIANKIVFSVESVDEDTGVASLKPESGWSGFLSAFKQSEGPLKVGLVYTGCTTSEIPEGFQSDGTIEVDMTRQGTERIPACMHANNFSSRTVDDVTYVTFMFENDCSIIEVFGLTGTSESENITGESDALASIQVEGLIEKCSYTLNTEGGLTFISGTTTVATTVTLDSSKWSITKDGDIKYNGYIKPVFIAAVPFEGEANKRTISVSATLGSEKTLPATSYGPLNFVHGNSYYIMANPVVAKTVDNVYFKTVNAAFSHAAELSGDTSGKYDTAEENIVTLVRDCGLAGVIKQDDSYVSKTDGGTPIFIDNYNVTFDLNGHVLTLAGGELFVVNGVEGGEDYVQDSQTLNTFIINDFKGKNADGKYDGKIYYLSDDNEEYSSDGEHIIRNFGSVQIDGGTLWNNDDWSAVRNYEGAVLTVNGGELYSDSWRTIHDEGGRVIVNDGKVSSGTSSAIYSKKGTVEISGGYIHADWAEAIQVYDGANCDISGGVISSEGNMSNATIRCYSEGSTISTLTIRWPDGISNPSPNTIQGPIIYSGESTSDSVLPVGTYHPQKNNSAKISIVGGYLITNNHLNLFYEDDSGENLMSNESGKLLFGNFYSNQPLITLYKNTTSKPINLYKYGNGNVIRNQNFYADPQGKNSGFYISEIEKSTGTLYKIDPVEENGYPGTDLEPVEIDGVIWAPVNCGYDADHPYGHLYQWGRKYGQGYDEEPGAPTEENGNLVYAENTDSWEAILFETHPDDHTTDVYEGNANKFFYNDIGEWYGGNTPPKINLWDSSSDVAVTDPSTSSEVSYHKPIKSKYDPCPDGWRVPTCYEFEVVLGSRVAGDSYEIGEDESTGAKGAYLCEGEFFLPFAGTRDGYYGEASERDEGAWYWTSSVYHWSFDNSYAPVLLDCGTTHFNTDKGGFGQACAIRCVKDE